jgi:hypothetical protein
MEESETKDNGLQIDSLLLDSVSTLETMKDVKDKLRDNRYTDIDTKLLTLYAKSLYLHILNNMDDINKMM